VLLQNCTVIERSKLSSLVRMDQQLHRCQRAVTEGPVEGFNHPGTLHAVIRLPADRAGANGSIQTARYRHPADVQMEVMSAAQKHLGAFRPQALMVPRRAVEATALPRHSLGLRGGPGSLSYRGNQATAC
jgi:hypothetical protein